MATARHEEDRGAVQDPDEPAVTGDFDAEVGREWMDRAAEIESDLRLLQWTACAAIVLAATVLFRVFTH